MKVLFTHERFPPSFGGGGEYLVSRAAKNLRERGVDVRVLTTGDPGNCSWEGVPVARVPVHRYLFNLAAPIVARHARDCDLIQTFNFHACAPSWLAGKWLGKPVVWLCLGVSGGAWKEMKGRFAGPAYQSVERWQLKRAFSQTVFLTQENLESAPPNADAGRRIVIPPAIEVDQCDPNRPKEPVVLFASKLDVRKRFEQVLEMAKRLPHVKFRMLGWGAGERTVRAMALPNLEFSGFLEGQEFRDAFAGASIFLLPSRAEGFPLVLLYAMASGCAVISTQNLEYHGLRFAVDDIDSMAAAIVRLWRDPELCREMGRGNAELASSYTWDAFTDSLLNVYEQVLQARGLCGGES